MTMAEVSSLASFLRPKHVMICIMTTAIVEIVSMTRLVLHPSTEPKLIHMDISHAILAAVMSKKKISQIMPEQVQILVPSASIFLNKFSFISSAQTRMYKAWKPRKPREKMQAMFK